MPRVKTERKPRAKQPPPATFACAGSCGGRHTDRAAGGWHGPEGALKWHCSACLPKRKTKTATQDDHQWYVLQVEPGQDRRVRKDIARKLRIEGTEHYVKKILIPTELTEIVTEERGEVIARGWEVEAAAARTAAVLKAKSLAGTGENEVGPDGATAVPGFRWAVSQNHDAGKGYGWNWSVRRKPPNPKALRKVVRVKKFPGYVLVHCRWDAYLDSLVVKVRGAWGFLLRPVIRDAKVTTTQSAATGLWAWHLRHPETNEILETAKGYAERGDAIHAGQTARDKFESFRPTAVKTREAAELLIGEKAVGQIVKDKKELLKVHYRPRFGDVVVVKGPHAFAGVECTVRKFDGKAGTADLKCRMLGTEVPIIGVAAWQLELKSRVPKKSKKESE